MSRRAKLVREELLVGGGEAVERQRAKEQRHAPPSVPFGKALLRVGKLEEHDAPGDEEDHEVLERRVALAAQEHVAEHDRHHLAGLGERLKRVAHELEALVGAAHGAHVAERDEREPGDAAVAKGQRGALGRLQGGLGRAGAARDRQRERAEAKVEEALHGEEEERGPEAVAGDRVGPVDALLQHAVVEVARVDARGRDEDLSLRPEALSEAHPHRIVRGRRAGRPDALAGSPPACARARFGVFGLPVPATQVRTCV
mmetsp:Transcript_19578/g.55953  ORF Transcript_19578/g.55953 Transcript_19578/m.55953 type:complete len:257 (-) Transcript_19578:92-862(-)